MNTTSSLKERILTAAANTPSPTRGQSRRAAALLVAVSVATGVSVFGLMGGLAHASARPLVFTVRLADGWALMACLLTWLVRREISPRVPSSAFLGAVTFASPVALCLWASFFHGRYVEPPAPDDWPCFVGTLAMAATPLACFLRWRRGAEPERPGMLGAAAGAASGVWAGVLALLWCPATDPSHVVLGHAAPIVLMTMMGCAFGSRTLAVERSLTPAYAPDRRRVRR
jgi:hypothetical protein